MVSRASPRWLLWPAARPRGFVLTESRQVRGFEHPCRPPALFASEIVGQGPRQPGGGVPVGDGAAGLPDGSFWLLGLTEAGAETFRLPLPDRGHAAAAHPSRPEAVAFARRPGTFALVIDRAEGRIAGTARQPGGPALLRSRRLQRRRALLFTTENAIAAGTGRLGVWDAKDGYRRIGEISSGGSGPHEVRLMPDGRRLAVANGGIETDPTSGRAELNLATMRSNLAYVDAGSG